jgi:hypothetical protein
VVVGPPRLESFHLGDIGRWNPTAYKERAV